MGTTSYLTCLLLMALLAIPDSDHGDRLPPLAQVSNNDPLLKRMDLLWTYDGRPFNGYMVERELDGTVVYRLPIIGGRENGVARGIYHSGEKLLERRFVDGKKEGVFEQWWPNGKLRYLFHYLHDRYDGEQIVYFPSGQVQEIKHYLAGQEEGSQRIWDRAGRLVSNYTVKNKRAYGILSAQDCMPVFH